MMYCKTCKTIFEADKAIRNENIVEYGLMHLTESVEIECPYCKSNDVVIDPVIVECSICGELLLEDDAFYANNEYICKHCYDEV